MLKAKLAQVMKEKILSTRQVALETGVSHTTILRALRGDTMDVPTILKLSEWLGVKPNTLINAMPSTKDSLAEKIAVMLEGNSVLAAQFQKAVDAIVEGKVEPSVVEDIASYAAYQVNMKTKSK